VNVTLDRRLFLLDEDQWDTLESILDAPPKALPKLAALLNKKAPWNK